MPEYLAVEEALPQDSGLGKARLSTATMKNLGVSPGDVVSLTGTKLSCGIVFTDHSQKKEGGIRLAQQTRWNSGVNLGDTVLVERVEPPPCSMAALTPCVSREKGKDILSLGLSEFIRSRLLRQPLSPDDTIIVTGIAIAGKGIPFRVTDLEPEGIVRVDENTRLILEAPAENDIQSYGDKFGYEDVGGLSDQLENIREMVELPIKMPGLFTAMGIAPPRGVLLHGPPGTGKTLITRALASEMGVRIFTIKGPEIMDCLYGRTERNLREVFNEAVAASPAIIFIDEIDSIAPKRDAAYGEVEKRVVAQLLTLMDSLPPDGRVMVVGTTNRPDALEEALRRPGRFDREVELPPPDEAGRMEILSIHSRGMPLSEDVDMKTLAEMTTGYVGADVQALCREAALSAVKRGMKGLCSRNDVNAGLVAGIKVRMTDFRDGMKKVTPTAIREITVQIPRVRFDDIGGLGSVKRDIRECVEMPFTCRDDYRRLGIKTPNGILLYGPPGTGKTLLARAVANQVRASFISVEGPEILSRFVGEAEKRLREIFKRARRVTPSIIFFDEVDSIARSREGPEHKGSGDNITNQLLTLLDGIQRFEDVIVIGATNRPGLIDHAFLRKGRFDRLIYVPPPDREGRRAILGIHAKRLPLAPGVDISHLAERTECFTGADLEGLCQEAAIEAFRELSGAECVTMTHFERALGRLRPSINEETVKYYNSINKKLTGRVTTGDDDTPPGYS